MSNVFDYWDFKLKLIQPCLGAQASANIMSEFVNEKNKKLIAQANSSEKKLLKSLKKYKGDQISQEKEIEELTALLRQRQQLIDIHEPIPTTVAEIVEYSKSLEERVAEYLENQDSEEVHKATVFLRDEKGMPAISTHIILGQLKSILSNVTNNSSDKESRIFKSKVAIGEALSMDFKFVETLVSFDKDIMKNEDGTRNLLIRPIRFMRMGQSVTAIAASEQVPAGATTSMTFRIRKDSPLNDEETLKYLFEHSKNIGIGSYRNSNMYGAYVFQLKKLENFKEDFGDWN